MRLLLLVILMFVQASAAFAYKVGSPPPAYLQCTQDSDCVWVSGDCCGFKTVVAEPYRLKWEELLKRRCPQLGAMPCPAVIDNGPIENLPGCVNKVCQKNTLQDYSSKTKDFCQGLKRPEERSVCFWSVATIKFDERLCSQIDDQNKFMLDRGQTSTACKEEVQRKRVFGGPIDFSFCNSLPNSSLIDACLDRLAAEQKDPGLCLRMNTPEQRSRCASQIVDPAKDSDQCATFIKKQSPEHMKLAHVCLQRTAILKKQPKICDRLYESLEGSPAMKYWSWYNCIQFVAQEAKKPDICKKLQERIGDADPYHREEHCRSFVGN